MRRAPEYINLFVDMRYIALIFTPLGSGGVSRLALECLISLYLLGMPFPGHQR